MLGSAHRLRRRGEFTAAVRSGRRAGRGGVVVHLNTPDEQAPDTGTSPTPSDAVVRGEGETLRPARVGFIVPRTVGSAVIRNKVRRRLRHLVRERLHTLPAGSTLVVRALPRAAELTYARLGADLDAALSAARSPRRTSGRSR